MFAKYYRCLMNRVSLGRNRPGSQIWLFLLITEEAFQNPVPRLHLKSLGTGPWNLYFNKSSLGDHSGLDDKFLEVRSQVTILSTTESWLP